MDADVIVVLSGGREADGSLSKYSMSRTERAVSLYKMGYAPKILFAGKQLLKSKNTFPDSDARAMAAYAFDLGVPADAITLEEESKDVVGHIVLVTKNHLIPQEWKKVILITSAFYLPRTRYVISRVLDSAYDINIISSQSDLEKKEAANLLGEEIEVLSFFEKWFKDIPKFDIEAWEKFLKEEHPGYSKTSKLSMDELP